MHFDKYTFRFVGKENVFHYRSEQNALPNEANSSQCLPISVKAFVGINVFLWCFLLVSYSLNFGHLWKNGEFPDN